MRNKIEVRTKPKPRKPIVIKAPPPKPTPKTAAPKASAPKSEVAHVDRIPQWPFARRSETISIAEWPKIWKKIRDRASKELNHEIDAAHASIKELLDERDVLKAELALSKKTLADVAVALKIDPKLLVK